MPIGNAPVALAKHAAEAPHALGVPAAVVPLPAEGHAQAKVTVAGETSPAGPVVVTRRLWTRVTSHVTGLSVDLDMRLENQKSVLPWWLWQGAPRPVAPRPRLWADCAAC